MPRKRAATEITLAEHVARIGKLGGVARAQKLSPEQLSEISQIAGRAGGKARAEKLTSKRRKEIAAKAAVARWSKKRKSAK